MYLILTYLLKQRHYNIRPNLCNLCEFRGKDLSLKPQNLTEPMEQHLRKDNKDGLRFIGSKNLKQQNKLFLDY